MTADNVHITPAHVNDATAIAGLSRNDIEYGLPWTWTPARIANCIRHEEFNVVVAKDAGSLAGFGIMQYDDTGASLSLLAVSAACRRRSIGTRIVAWLEQVAVNAGIFDIVVQLRERNTGAEAFYQRLAFEPMDRVEGYYCNGETALVLSKQLAETVNQTIAPWQPSR
jgi:ribosomal-protein-alanine N-acetyltransferase